MGRRFHQGHRSEGLQATQASLYVSLTRTASVVSTQLDVAAAATIRLPRDLWGTVEGLQATQASLYTSLMRTASVVSTQLDVAAAATAAAAAATVRLPRDLWGTVGVSTSARWVTAVPGTVYQSVRKYNHHLGIQYVYSNGPYLFRTERYVHHNKGALESRVLALLLLLATFCTRMYEYRYIPGLHENRYSYIYISV